MYLCMYVCMHACIYDLYIYIYIYTHTYICVHTHMGYIFGIYLYKYFVKVSRARPKPESTWPSHGPRYCLPGPLYCQPGPAKVHLGANLSCQGTLGRHFDLQLGLKVPSQSPPDPSEPRSRANENANSANCILCSPSAVELLFCRSWGLLGRLLGST